MSLEIGFFERIKEEVAFVVERGSLRWVSVNLASIAVGCEVLEVAAETHSFGVGLVATALIVAGIAGITDGFKSKNFE